MENNHHYNKNLRPFARQHRTASTKAEIRIWCELLRDCQTEGYRFHRQRPVLNYIADFMCKELNLIIEIDGITHDSKTAFVKDEKRQQELEEAGFAVLRFSDWEVINDIGGVGVLLRDWILGYEEKHPEVKEKKRKKRPTRSGKIEDESED